MKRVHIVTFTSGKIVTAGKSVKHPMVKRVISSDSFTLPDPLFVTDKLKTPQNTGPQLIIKSSNCCW